MYDYVFNPKKIMLTSVKQLFHTSKRPYTRLTNRKALLPDFRTNTVIGYRVSVFGIETVYNDDVLQRAVENSVIIIPYIFNSETPKIPYLSLNG